MMRAKMRVAKVTRHNDTCEELEFNAVAKSDGYPPDGNDENNTFAKWTPSANLKMTITNPALIGRIFENQEFYVDFTEADCEPDH